MQYISGKLLRTLREGRRMTQRELAELLCVSDKTISKWETERGLPDLTILPELAAALGVSLPELLGGEAVVNRNRAGNLKRTKIYVCPVCGNAVFSLGESVVSCCGIRLPAQEAEDAEDGHEMRVSVVDDEYCVEMTHPMTREHSVSFVAYLTDGRMMLEKLYPEQDICVRFPRRGHGVLYSYCNRHGLKMMRI